MKNYLTSNLKISYFVFKVIPHILTIFIVFYFIKDSWTPFLNIEKNYSHLVLKLFSVYLLFIISFFILFISRIRFVIWYPIIAFFIVLLFLNLPNILTQNSKDPFEFFFQKYSFLLYLGTFFTASINGIGFARWKTYHYYEIGCFLLSVPIFSFLLDKHLGEKSYYIIGILIWYIFHSIFIEKYYRSLAYESEPPKKLILNVFSKYVLNVFLFFVIILLFVIYYFIPSSNTLSSNNEIEKKKKRPYVNLGRTGVSKDNKRNHYIHDLTPEVRFDDKIDYGDKTLLYTIFVKNFKELKENITWSGNTFPFYYTKFVLSHFDEEKFIFTLNPKHPEYNTFFKEPYDFANLEFIPGTVIPFNTKMAQIIRERRNPFFNIQSSIALSPYVKDNAVIAPQFPIHFYIGKKLSKEEIKNQINQTLQLQKTNKFITDDDFEKVNAGIYNVGSFSMPVNLPIHHYWMMINLLSNTSNNFPEIQLTPEEYSYYTDYGKKSVSKDVINLTRSKVGLNSSTIDKISKIYYYFQNNFQYTLTPGIPKDKEKNYLEYFLLENKKGYCQYYAIATTLMLRILDVPARVAVGFIPIDRSVKNSGYLYIYANQAHAWTEVFIDGLGWIPIDTTVSDERLEEQLSPPSPDSTPPDLKKEEIEGVVTLIGKVTSIDDTSITIHLQNYQIGAPLELKRAYSREEKKTGYDDNLFVSKRKNLIQIQDPQSIDFFIDYPIKGLIGKEKIRENILFTNISNEIKDIFIDNPGKPTIFLTGKIQNDLLKNKTIQDAAQEMKIEYIGMYKPQEYQPRSYKKYIITFMAIIVILVLISILAFPSLLAYYLYKNSLKIHKPYNRLRILFNYVYYRLYLMGFRIYGYTIMEWTEYLFQEYKIDIR